jgi:hypothetical protein
MPGLSADTADAPKSALQRRQQQTKRGSALPRLPVEHKAVQVGDAVGNFRSSSLSNSSFSDSSFELDKHVLKQRLSDTVAICQQLARSLDARSRNARAATSAGCDDLTANSVSLISRACLSVVCFLCPIAHDAGMQRLFVVFALEKNCFCKFCE